MGYRDGTPEMKLNRQPTARKVTANERTAIAFACGQTFGNPTDLLPAIPFPYRVFSVFFAAFVDRSFDLHEKPGCRKVVPGNVPAWFRTYAVLRLRNRRLQVRTLPGVLPSSQLDQPQTSSKRLQLRAFLHYLPPDFGRPPASLRLARYQPLLQPQCNAGGRAVWWTPLSRSKSAFLSYCYGELRSPTSLLLAPLPGLLFRSVLPSPGLREGRAKQQAFSRHRACSFSGSTLPVARCRRPLVQGLVGPLLVVVREVPPQPPLQLGSVS